MVSSVQAGLGGVNLQTYKHSTLKHKLRYKHTNVLFKNTNSAINIQTSYSKIKTNIENLHIFVPQRCQWLKGYSLVKMILFHISDGIKTYLAQ